MAGSPRKRQRREAQKYDEHPEIGGTEDLAAHLSSSKAKPATPPVSAETKALAANLPDVPKLNSAGDYFMPDRGGQPPPKGWEDRFIEGLRKTGLIKEACRLAGCSRSYILKQRKARPEFEERIQEVRDEATDLLEQIAIRRAADGSDPLIMFMLRSQRPKVYRDNVQHEHQHNVSGQVGFAMLDGKQPIEFAAQNRREAARALLAGDPGDDVIEGSMQDEVD